MLGNEGPASDSMRHIMPQSADPAERAAIVKHGMRGPMADQVYGSVLPHQSTRAIEIARVREGRFGAEIEMLKDKLHARQLSIATPGKQGKERLLALRGRLKESDMRMARQLIRKRRGDTMQRTASTRRFRAKRSMRRMERAIARADLDSALVAVSQGAPPSAILRSGETPASAMTRLGAAEHLAALVNLGARLNQAAPRTGLPPLHLAVRRNDRRMVQALIELGAPLDQVVEPVVIDVLDAGDAMHLGAGANVGGVARRSEGMSPLMMAAALGPRWLALMVDLLDAGARGDLANAGGRTALMFAARLAQPATVRVLVDEGCNPSMLDRGGFGAADWLRASARERVLRDAGGTT